MAEHADPTPESMPWHPASAGWDIVTVVHSRSGVELRLLPALHFWDFPARGERFAYGRDEYDALSRFARLLASERQDSDTVSG